MPTRSGGALLGLEVVARLEVGDEAGLHGLPAEALAGQRARGRDVGREEAPDPPEVLGRLLRSDRGRGNAEVAPATVLRRRGVADPAASLAAEAGIAVFRVAFERWIADDEDRDATEVVQDSFDQLKAVTSNGT
jgi:hypothetical protein